MVVHFEETKLYGCIKKYVFNGATWLCGFGFYFISLRKEWEDQAVKRLNFTSIDRTFQIIFVQRASLRSTALKHKHIHFLISPSTSVTSGPKPQHCFSVGWALDTIVFVRSDLLNLDQAAVLHVLSCTQRQQPLGKGSLRPCKCITRPFKHILLQELAKRNTSPCKKSGYLQQ